MKKSDYIGWQEVFRFSLIQGMKQKAYKVFIILVCTVLLFSQPVKAFIDNRDKEEAFKSEVTEFTIYDEVGLPIDYTKSLAGEGFEDVKINTTPSISFEEHVKRLEEESKDKESEKSKEIIVNMIYEEAGYFNLTFVKASNAALKDNDCEKLMEAFSEYFDEERINAIQVTQEQMEFLNRPVDTKVEFVTETGERVPEKPQAESIGMEEYMIIMLGIMVVTFMLSTSGQSIANSIVTEKSTRVVEYLMINVRPMALITGKILASLLLVMIQFTAMGVSFGISSLLKLLMFGESTNMAVNMGGAEVAVEASAFIELVSGVSIIDILLGLAVVFAGLMFYCIIAGLAGASVSKLEELSEGLKVYSILTVVGAYLGMGMCMTMSANGGNEMFTNFCCLFPFSSPFVVLPCLLLGKASVGMALISLGVLLIVTFLLFSFTAKVYESMIFYNGKVLKLKDILQIAKNRKQVERKEEKSHE